ncbi:PEP synthetase regulatory protein [Fictibacillus macauensis ZFHKF-1]|uniref:Putative pyruvate, phosphate dikinase regulatory protein n=1 Tax=Fictibacillus macauensis ZFHKF-1 TaxID=1196324 RepID=I8J0D6_9BACL|nr:pyruvate, water dikinase regulatory protein [Fictibacillus macauensis]EIT85206.1 PEP synthetase regulatory protein [Fictibacillus macauensis ZFHKF-1]
MSVLRKRPVVYIVSDSVGETAELVVKAAASQFNSAALELKRVPYVEDKETIKEVVALAKEQEALIAFTLVIPEMKDCLLEEAAASQVVAIDIIGPMMTNLQGLLQQVPRYEPGIVHQLDDDYFRKVEAIEFAVKYDDGRDPRGILKADIVLIGVSRTSKTPLSQYLAHKRLKVANVPLVPEVEPPEELFKVSPRKCFGLGITAEKLNDIRKERLMALGLNAEANYANMNRIHQELAYFDAIVKKIGCRVVDVSNKAVEESANHIYNIYIGKSYR